MLSRKRTFNVSMVLVYKLDLTIAVPADNASHDQGSVPIKRWSAYEPDCTSFTAVASVALGTSWKEMTCAS